MDIYVIKKQGVLIPATPEDEEKFKKIKPNSVIKVVFKIVRNPKFHRLYFSLIGYAFERYEQKTPIKKGDDSYIDIDNFRENAQILAGHKIVKFDFEGKAWVISKSIKYESLSQEKFEQLYKTVYNIIWERFCFDHTKPELDKAIVERLLQYS